MLTNALATTFRILLFRAGPQDMPYHPGLARLAAFAAIATNAMLMAQLAPAWLALLVSIAAVLGVVLATEMILRARDLSNRAQQTLSALLATSTVINLLMLLPMTQIAPHLAELSKHPELLKKPDSVRLPMLPVLGVDALNIWGLAISAHIFRNAADTKVLGGVGLALICALTVLMVVFFVAGVTGALLGH